MNLEIVNLRMCYFSAHPNLAVVAAPLAAALPLEQLIFRYTSAVLPLHTHTHTHTPRLPLEVQQVCIMDTNQ